MPALEGTTPEPNRKEGQRNGLKNRWKRDLLQLTRAMQKATASASASR